MPIITINPKRNSIHENFRFITNGSSQVTCKVTVDKHIMQLAFKKKELTDLFEDVMKDIAVDKYLFQNK